MNKKLLKSTLAVAMVAVAGYGSYEAYEESVFSDSNKSLLLAENVEALSVSAREVEMGATIYKICSRKPGIEFCTINRGKRKWTLPITFIIKNSEGSTACPKCPDTDYSTSDNEENI